MIYKLNGISLESLGALPGIIDDSPFALSGFFDMPARLGKTHHKWADENGIEPYVLTEDIFYGGRDLKLALLITHDDANVCEAIRSRIMGMMNSYNTLVPLETDFGTFQVRVSGQVTVNYTAKNILTMIIPLREPSPNLSGGILPSVGATEFGIDGLSFQKLGGGFLSISDSAFFRPAPDEMDAVIYGAEAGQITKYGYAEPFLSFYITQPSLSLFKGKIQALYQLFSSSGLRKLKIANFEPLFFVKDGFSVSSLTSSGGEIFGIVEVKIAIVTSE